MPADLVERLATVLLVQALPLVVVAALGRDPGARRSAFYRVNLALLGMRLGLAAGLSRAYAPLPWSYWLSPLTDLPVAARLIEAVLRRTWTWRGVELAKDST